MSSREVIEVLNKAGWLLDSVRGDHHHFKHPTLPGKVTVRHPVKDLSLMEIKSIEKQAIQKIR
ncbi:MAG: type II toxin-antitoxin system HicA family toxin [Magnetococcales bacterium]|nr:type II toxin-antitoxin system HicA family toxin [Magnetococcales bacterium]